ncbi:MAG: hypothetical protein EA355_10605 [Rhodobacteraceae bacterium]|nr:MAG: hypothetical protein EA355_10605 [Paracoccaceae bacterium]
MDLIADVLLIAGAVGAAFYCRTLSRRLGALKDLDSGLGAAIAALSRQVDELRASLDAAKAVSGDQTRDLAQLAARAEMAAGRLEMLLASLHENGKRRPVSPPPRRSIFDEDEDEDEDEAEEDAFADLRRADRTPGQRAAAGREPLRAER